MKIEIFNEADRLEVAAILVRTPTGKSFVYYIEAEKVTPVIPDKAGEPK